MTKAAIEAELYLFAAAVITPLHTLGPAGIPLLFVGLALYGCEMERRDGRTAWVSGFTNANLFDTFT
jgi:hypothetical protein